MSFKNKMVIVFVGLLMFALPHAVSAHGASSSSGLSESEQGAKFYSQLVSGKVACANLEDDEFELMGDFYMERMMGASAHEQMDKMMADQLGETANGEMHIVMAKRLSGCDVNASYPVSASNHQWLSGITGMGMMDSNRMRSSDKNNSIPNTTWFIISALVGTILVHLYLLQQRGTKHRSSRRRK